MFGNTMIKIFVRNVHSTLSEHTPESVIEELEKRLTVKHPNYWFSPKFKAGFWDGRTHFLKIPSLNFPSGLLFIIKEYCEETNTECEIVDLRGKPDVSFSKEKEAGLFSNDYLKGIILRDYQIDAIREAIRKERGVLELPTASGKTEIAAAIIKALDLKTLFVVHTKDLLHQTIERFKLRLERDDIGIVGDGEFDAEHDIVVATMQTINRIDIKNFKNFLNQFQVMFQDECHHSSALSFYKIGMFMHNAHFRYGMSGTALRRDVLSNMKVMAITGAPIYQLKAAKLIDKGYLSEIEIKMIDNPEEVSGAKWQKIYKAGIVQSEDRNWKIVDLVFKAYKQGKRVMVLVRQIEHGNILQKMIDRFNIPTQFIWGFHEGWEREQVKGQFNVNGDFVLIASPIYDEGVDLPEVNVLMIATGGKSEWKTVQKVGRGLRLKEDGSQLIVYDFYDHSKYLEEHSQERIEIYKREGFLK